MVGQIIRSRRINCWWEPTYNPAAAKKFTMGDWVLPDRGAFQKLFDAKALKELVLAGPANLHFKNIDFKECDFFGDFSEIDRDITFRNCTFDKCDFGLSTWSKAKFRSCKFIGCSLSQTRWANVEFRNSTWENVGLSGNETVFENVYVDDPENLIVNISTNISAASLAKGKTTKEYQLYRLEETKATVSRNIYNSHKIVGDEDAFYRACKIHLLQTCRGRQARHRYDLFRPNNSTVGRLRSLLFLGSSDLEAGLVWTFGTLTKWGGSILRPLVGLFLVISAYTVLFHYVLNCNWHLSFERSFDIATVTGYGRAVQYSDGGWFLRLAWSELVFSILFYTVFFTVAVAKISRVR